MPCSHEKEASEKAFLANENAHKNGATVKKFLYLTFTLGQTSLYTDERMKQL